MFLVIEVLLLCFGHLLQLIKIFRDFVLFDLFLLVQKDAGAEEMRAKTRGILRVYIILTQWPASQDLRLYIEWKRYVYLSPHIPCAICKGRAAARIPGQRQVLRRGCLVLQWEGRLWAGVRSPSVFLPLLGRTSILAEIMSVDPKCTCGGVILTTGINWIRVCLGSSESGFFYHPLKTFLRLHSKLQHK